MTAEAAAEFIHHGDSVGISGFTGAGYPKAVPAALARRIEAAHARGEEFRIGLLVGCLDRARGGRRCSPRSTALDKRLPYNSDPTLRTQINSGEVDYVDTHLSHSAQHMWFGFYGHARRRRRRGHRGPAQRAARAGELGREQQDLGRPCRPGHPRGQPLAAAGPRGLPRHLLRNPAATAPGPDPADPADAADR